MKTKENDWQKHPCYLADAGGLFGAPPRLKCQYCHKGDYELFYGHCRECAEKNNIPKNRVEPQEFHDALNKGASVVVNGIPKTWYPWWHWRRWFSIKK